DRRRLAEKRRLLAKAKMKGRKGKKGTKNAAKNANAANTAQQSAPTERHEPPPDKTSVQNYSTPSEECVAEAYDDDPPPNPAPLPQAPSRIPQPIAHAQHQSLRDVIIVVGEAVAGRTSGPAKIQERFLHLLTLRPHIESVLRDSEFCDPQDGSVFASLTACLMKADLMTFDLGTNRQFEWVHDRYDDDPQGWTSAPDLFTRIGPINSLALRYDRAGRSSGTAFVTYQHLSDARLAIREFDGANAHGQPIRLALLPVAPSHDLRSRAAPIRNPFDTVERPSRSLFDRIDDPRFGNASRSRGGRSRSRSPGMPRRSDVTKPPPEGVD
ncbi:MAG: hypothetical protein Q9177_006517, partial [Variospora cf. flavescens]